MTLGTLPKGCRYVNRLALAFQRSLEAAVRAVHGEITFSLASLVNSATRAERGALLIQRWMRESDAKLSPSEKLNFNREYWAFTERRDRCIRALKLGAVDATAGGAGDSPWSALDELDAEREAERRAQA